MTLRGSHFVSTTLPGLSIYYTTAGLGGTANVVATWTAGGYSILFVEVWSGADAAGLRAAQTNGATGGTTAAVTYTNGQVGDTIIGVAGLLKALDGTATLTVGANQIEVRNATTGTGTLHATGATSYEAGAASVVMDWTISASSRWGVVAAAIIPAAASGGGRLVGGSLVQEWFTRGLLAG